MNIIPEAVNRSRWQEGASEKKKEKVFYAAPSHYKHCCGLHIMRRNSPHFPGRIKTSQPGAAEKEVGLRTMQPLRKPARAIANGKSTAVKVD
jgi:hypothetical protein